MLVKRKGGLPSFGSAFDDLFDFEKFFDSDLVKKSFVPAVNIKENENNFHIELAAPGLNKSDFNISVENGVLNISAEKKEENEETTKNYTRKEFSYNSFSRSFSLPESVREDGIEATYKEGVLELILNKKEENKVKPSRKIEIG